MPSKVGTRPSKLLFTCDSGATKTKMTFSKRTPSRSHYGNSEEIHAPKPVKKRHRSTLAASLRKICEYTSFLGCCSLTELFCCGDNSTRLVTSAATTRHRYSASVKLQRITAEAVTTHHLRGGWPVSTSKMKSTPKVAPSLPFYRAIWDWCRNTDYFP